jgi:large subunit ribosomal protein L31
VKPAIHPDYHKVIFVDTASGTEWTTRSTMGSSEMREVDGEQVPVIRLEVSSVSHPFWTGQLREAARGGKVDEFRRRYGKKK